MQRPQQQRPLQMWHRSRCSRLLAHGRLNRPAVQTTTMTAAAPAACHVAAPPPPVRIRRSFSQLQAPPPPAPDWGPHPLQAPGLHRAAGVMPRWPAVTLTQDLQSQLRISRVRKRLGILPAAIHSATMTTGPAVLERAIHGHKPAEQITQPGCSPPAQPACRQSTALWLAAASAPLQTRLRPA